jgi:hypothetical protein
MSASSFKARVLKIFQSRNTSLLKNYCLLSSLLEQASVERVTMMMMMCRNIFFITMSDHDCDLDLLTQQQAIDEGIEMKTYTKHVVPVRNRNLKPALN